jgi:enamine deaminase RidA (YjgF/YER057c/UK114 family)
VEKRVMTITRLHSDARMSQTVVHNGTVYLAGQVGAPGCSVSVQTRAILDKIGTLLKEAGSAKSNILSATIWLADMADYAEMNVAWDAWIGGDNPPARATAQVKLASLDYKIEIIAIAACD